MPGTHYEDAGAQRVATQPTMVECPSGLYVDIADPNPETLLLTDIAHKLSQNNRWGGSGSYPISVAQHAVYTSLRVKMLGGNTRQQLLALHHDDHEAYLLDIPRPWKALLGQVYRRLTRMFDKRITKALALPAYEEGDAELVKLADNFMMLLEAKHVMPSQGKHWYSLKRGEDGMPLKIVTPAWWMGEIDWRSARQMYLDIHAQLMLTLLQEKSE